MTDAIAIPAALVAAYLLGSIPFGLLLTRMAGAGDVRAVGSGNIGATNVLRTGSKGLAAATLLLDGLKGYAAVVLAREIAPGWEPVAGVAAVLGHCYPLWLGFRGGKGVATMAGVAFGFALPIGLAYAGAWLAGLALSRISSVAGIASALIAPLTAWLLGREAEAVALAVLMLVVLWQHRQNLARLRAGEEPKVGGRK